MDKRTDIRVTGGDPSAGRDTPGVFVWCFPAVAAGFGLAGLYGFHVVDGQWVRPVIVALLFGAAAVAVSNGWIWGSPPSETRSDVNTRIARGLVGTTILTPHGAVTVVDDSASGGDRRRRSVKAVDETGSLGLLFVELDRTGRVVAAAVPGGRWAPAHSLS